MRRALALALTAALALGAGPAAAQQAAGGGTGNGKSATFFTRGDLAFWGGVTVATAALWQFDDNIADYLTDSSHRSSALDNLSVDLRKVNERSAAAATLVTYVIGKVAGKPRVAEVGLHATEGVVAAMGAQTLIKNAFGRSRPFVSLQATGHHNQNDLHPGKGFSNPWYRSMPSLHTGGMFGAVVVTTSELDRWHPGSMRYVRPVAFLVALSPGLARMYDDRHWSTDVLVGAATGYWAAKKVMRYHHPPSDPDRRRRIDRWLLGADVGSIPDGGMRLGMSINF